MTQVLDQLRLRVDAYFVRHPKATIPSLARQAGIGASTLRRILQGESKASFETAWALLGVVCETDAELQAAMHELFPDSAKALKPGFDNASLATSTAQYREVVRTRAGFVVTNLAAMDCGITRAQARRLAGYEGERVLETLLDMGIVTGQPDGKYRSASFSHCDARLILDQIGVASQLFDTTLAGTPAAGAMLKTASVSADALLALKEELKRFVGRVMEIAEAPQNSGEYPVFLTAMMNLLDPESYEKKEV